MKLYLDDDAISGRLIQALRRDGHDAQVPGDVGLGGDQDAVHQTHCIREDRVLISYNHRDFDHLHVLIRQSGGVHPGIFIVRRDDDQRRDMSPQQISLAIQKLIKSGVPITNQFIILNHWR
ncbi:MAG: DUF5615 family PIN-like protein [Pirellulaceae bacterium]